MVFYCYWLAYLGDIFEEKLWFLFSMLFLRLGFDWGLASASFFWAMKLSKSSNSVKLKLPVEVGLLRMICGFWSGLFLCTVKSGSF